MTVHNVIACLTNVGTAALAIALALPLMRRKVKMNGWYGVRFPRSYESDELWYRINEYGGRRLVQWSFVLVVLGVAALFVTSEAWLFWLLMAPMLYLIPCIDAYLYTRRI